MACVKIEREWNGGGCQHVKCAEKCGSHTTIYTHEHTATSNEGVRKVAGIRRNTTKYTGHAKLRGRVLRHRRCMKPVQCKHECYVMKQHCLWCVRACENEYINNCQTVVMQRCRRVHFQAYSYGPVCKTTLKSSKHCHWLCNSLLATPGMTLRLRCCS